MSVSNSAAVAALEEAGAFVQKNVHGDPIVVNLFNTPVTDTDLKALQELSALQMLVLRGCNQISDDGLKYLHGLRTLELLNLNGTPVSDAGLEHLKGLTNLKTLLLGGTPITDDGLEHLNGLSNLQKLYLSETDITVGGLSRFRQALPNCEIQK